MARRKRDDQTLTRRNFIKGVACAPLLFVPAPLQGIPFSAGFTGRNGSAAPVPFDFRLTPHYPAKSPLDDVLRLVTPGADEYVTEKYAFEIMPLLAQWSNALKIAAPGTDVVATFLDVAMESTTLIPATETKRRSGAIEVVQRQFAKRAVQGRERFLQEIKNYFADLASVGIAEFEIVGIEETESAPPSIRAHIRYTLIGKRPDSRREQRIGHWMTQWLCDTTNAWRVRKWEASEETVSRAHKPVFIDITSQALGGAQSYRDQLLHGADYWRTVLDGACGIDVYGNNGIAVGDVDGDGLDAIYVCQPAGLPNRLYRNRGDGTFEDVTEKSGVGVLDATACALFADFENKRLQDLLVVCGGGPLLFLNQGNGKFVPKRDAFKFARPPQGTFTHAAIADYDGDGLLDIYFCLYSYYQGLDQYRYPVPYFDARNGPPNVLLHNEGNATFQDRTEPAGLNAENDRYSFACAWGDSTGNGWPDLYVANDFGRNNLYRNNGDGSFTAVSREAGVEDVGAGMSACWFDFDNDGKQDIYVADMWSAAGLRVSAQKHFQGKEPEGTRALYRQHASGNTLYQNRGAGKFENASAKAGVEMARWAWSSDVWDFDHDGHPDLYIANGYISGAETRDLASFFWRQVVGKSPASPTPSPRYEQGWNAINELIRSDSSWNGYERNVFFVNNGDGTFSDASGITGLDFPDDSRAFALTDLDRDGRLEVVLKNRNGPQLRILRNTMKDIGDSIAFRLRGTKSNRDAIGAAVSVEAGGHRQTKYLQAGSGFLSQHSKELFFGLGKSNGPVRASIRWPGGLIQSFEGLPANHRIEIREGSEKFVASAFSTTSYWQPATGNGRDALSATIETWLIEPLNAPDFSLPDLAGKEHNLQSFSGSFVLLTFWSTASSAASQQLRALQRQHPALSSHVRIVSLNVDETRDIATVKSFVSNEGITFAVLLGTDEVAGVYNIIYRYLFDCRRDLAIPTSFLIDESGMIVKVYQGPVDPMHVLEDVRTAPRTTAERIRSALPFPGTLYQGEFRRNAFTYGVALFQRGYLEQAAESFKQVIAAKPDDPEAYYNLGTLYLRRNDFANARQNLERAVKLRPNYPEAWNNLGMLAAQQNQPEQAISNFKQSLLLRPDYVVALLNLGNLYRRERNFAEAEKLLGRALELEPDNPEVNYGLGILYGQQEQSQRASEYLERAVSLRPDYPEALNNLGVLLVREQRLAEAESRFKTCIDVAPNFDQAYLNLARLYAMQNDNEKAKKVLLALLQKQPQHKLAQQALEMLH